MEPTESEFILLHEGAAVVRDTLTPVDDIVRLWRSGVNMGDIPERLPGVSVAHVFAALRYARDHAIEQPPG